MGLFMFRDHQKINGPHQTNSTSFMGVKFIPGLGGERLVQSVSNPCKRQWSGYDGSDKSATFVITNNTIDNLSGWRVNDVTYEPH